MNKQTSIRLPEEIISEVEKLAKKKGRSNNFYYVKWIEKGLEREKKSSKD